MDQECGRVLLIGIGNESRGDDGAGLMAARFLVNLGRRLPGHATVIENDGDATKLVELWGRDDVVFVIDAVKGGGVRPGEVYRTEIGGDVPTRAASTLSTHGLGLMEAVGLSRALARLPERLVLYGIGIECSGVGATLSPAVRQAAWQVAVSIFDEVAILQEATPCA